MQHFTSVNDVESVPALVGEALKLKKDPFGYDTLGKHKTLGLIFFNSSLRTRLSTQKAANNLGMEVMLLNVTQDGWGLETKEGVIMNGSSGEHIKEAAAVIGQYCTMVGIRSFPKFESREEDYEDVMLNKFRQHAGVPIISLETTLLHPLQSLADMVTIEEFKKTDRPKVVMSWAPHFKALPQAVPNSFAQWVVKVNAEVVITHPEGYELKEEYTQGLTIEYDQHKALEGADFVYAKNWSSYNDYGKVIYQEDNWMIDKKKMDITNNAKFMHCLPVRRNLVVSDEVLDSESSIVIQQAANRECAAQAVLKQLLEDNR